MSVISSPPVRRSVTPPAPKTAPATPPAAALPTEAPTPNGEHYWGDVVLFKLWMLSAAILGLMLAWQAGNALVRWTIRLFG